MMTMAWKGIAMQKTVLTAVLAWAVASAWAQAPAPQAKKHAPPQAAAQAKAAHAKVQGKTTPVKAPMAQAAHKPLVKVQAKVPAQPKPVLPAALAAMPMPTSPLGNEELAIAERVHKGHLSCELGASVRVEADAHQPGYFDVRGKGFHYRMHPVSTSTGAIRLEDQQAGAVWLQLANKSMLMDQNKGRRIADECAHPEQMAFAQNMKHNPPPKLFDTTGMGR
ncbi:MAG: hypothetical protein RLZZ464_1857 [Pseudomonadota bacterium]|jgi:hypothetical protein